MTDRSTSRLPDRARPGGDGRVAPKRRIEPDNTNYPHRHFINLAATAFLLAVAVAMVWTIKLMEEHERLQACIDSGRRDCVPIDEFPRSRGPQSLVR